MTYHDLPVKEVLKELKTDRSGLSKEEAVLRLKNFGENKLSGAKRFSALKLFLHQFKNPLIYILFAALIISFLTGHFVDASIVLAVILASSVVGFVQEYKANQALEQLKKLIKYKARVLRDNEKVIVQQENLAQGDIIFLSPGDKIPADARLLEVNNLEVVEAALTGESVPSKKITEVFSVNTPLADRENMVYMGTVVIKGTAVAVVVATGHGTEIGKVAKLVSETEDMQTPLQKKVNSFGKKLGILLVAVNVIIFGAGVLAGRDILEMFLVAVAIVVAAVPEGLLPAMTIILAVGMQKLAKRKGLVRKMLAAETLGSVSVICADKTGTLTKGEMRVLQVITETQKIFSDGEKFLQEIKNDTNNSCQTILKISLLCNNSVVENPEENLEKWKIVGDPTEKALLLAGHMAGLSSRELQKKEKRIAEIAFDSQYKMMATLHQYAGEPDKTISYAKGAPEKILELSSFVDHDGVQRVLSDAKKAEIKNRYEALSASGLRVLAFGYRITKQNILAEDFTRESLSNFVFVGFVAIKDPVRPEAKRTIRLCQEAGIRTIIATGDHKLTSLAVVKELGITVSEENTLEGVEIEKLSDAELREKVKTVVIFARLEPKHKIRIITSLQENGDVVAMMGDGVNDAPALKKADIGVVVGSGTDVSKEIADLVLLDDNFGTIPRAIESGRNTFNNIRKVILYLVTDSFTEIVLIGGAILLKFPLPILPVQILWIKLAEGAAPAIALAFDEVNEDVMKEAPRKKLAPIVSKAMTKLIIFYALTMDLILFTMFYYYWKIDGDFELARTMVFVGLGLSSFFYIFSVRGLKISIFKINLFSNKFLLGAITFGLIMLVVAVYVPFFNTILHTVPLEPFHWLVLLGYATLSIFVYETGKKFTIAKDCA